MDSRRSSFDTNWNDLPNEVKVLIIRLLDNNCRLSLRTCSRQDLQLVDSVPFRTIHSVVLFDEKVRWNMNIIESEYGNQKKIVIGSFEELQNNLTEVMENADYIKNMSIHQTNTEKYLELSPKTKIGKLQFYKKDIDPQTESNLNSGVFDKSQVTNTSFTYLGDNYLRDDQLLELDWDEIHLEMSKNLTVSGINKFLKKCLSNLETKQVSFRIMYNGSSSGVLEGFYVKRDIAKKLPAKVILISELPTQFELEIECGDGFICGKTLRQLTPIRIFKVVQLLEIEFEKESEGKLIIEEKHTSRRVFEFHSVEELQNALTKEINKIAYVRKLCIPETTHFLNLKTSQNRNLTVGKLCIYGENCVEILKQIEPVHLKEIDFRGTTEDENVYDMPQVIHAQKLEFSWCWTRDDQLLKLEAVWLDIQTNVNDNRVTLTDSGLNEFLKKRLLTLNKSDFYLNVYFFGRQIDPYQFFKGLDIISPGHPSPAENWYVIVGSPYPQFQLEISKSFRWEDSDSFYAKRIQSG